VKVPVRLTNAAGGFRGVFYEIASWLREAQASRAASGRGTDGSTLAPRKKDGQRPGGTRPGIPARLRRASIRVWATGWSLAHDFVTDRFNDGKNTRRNVLQPARPVVGSTPQEQQQMARMVGDAILSAAAGMGITKRKGGR